MAKKKKDVGGRPPLPKNQVRRHRGNLLLDDAEKKVFDRWVEELAAEENRDVKGAELLRRVMLPILWEKAKHFQMKLGGGAPTPDTAMSLDYHSY